MQPQYQNGQFFQVQGPDGPVYVPSEDYSEQAHGEILSRETGWFARLSMPGYLDCTEWEGPFGSEEEAQEHVSDTHGVHPISGEVFALDFEDEEDWG